MRLKIREMAERQGLMNANQLATIVGVPRMTAGRWWDGEVEPTLSMLERMCLAWDCELADLVEIEKPPRRRAPIRRTAAKKKARSKKRRAP